jgi:hypothetical protein
MIQISKSEFLMFLKHPALLWLKKNDKSKLPPIDDNLQAIFDAGNLFESYAQKIFGEGSLVGWSIAENNYGTMPQRTMQAITDGATTIFQGRFETGNITCICDVVKVIGKNKVDLFEIKSGSSVKQDNIYDLAFQTIVLEDAGYSVRNIGVVTVNGFYRRKGEIDPHQLCVKNDVTQEVRDEIEEIRELIPEAVAIAQAKAMPEINVPTEDGDIYGWLDLMTIFETPQPGSIFDLCWPKQRIAELHAMGIKNLVDIPEDFKLSPKQKAQVKAAKTNLVSIDENAISQCVDAYEFPLYFLDYETLASVIPPFDGLGPYQQLPFQYSLHVLDEPDGLLQHYSYLHAENSDPTVPLSEALQSVIGTSGTILTWNERFEKGCNDLMATIHPEFKKFYRDVNKRIEDLCIPFQKNWYVHKDFLGSYSIKKVLPVLVPELSYKDLGINEGGSAQRKWMGSVLGEKYAAEKQQILRDLEKYCELDTLAMVKIYEVLKLLSKSEQLAFNV